MKAITLQINLSPGDVGYAARTVPRLLAAHPGVAERLLVIDVCRPQRTAIIDPERRYPEPEFSQRCSQIVALAEALRQSGAVDRVEILRPADPRFPEWRQRFLRSWVHATHDYGGCALMAYLAAFALCRTRWLLHYDADMMLHQPPGYDWAAAAALVLTQDSEVIAATPRPSPPSDAATDQPTRQERLPLRINPAGWLNQWFSTRCYLFDCERLGRCLPLLQGRVYWETCLARLRRRGYPRSPETMLFRRLSACGYWRLILRRRDTWLLHPAQKDAAWLAALPELLDAVGAGRCPEAQRGNQDLQLAWWRDSADTQAETLG